MHKWHLPIFWFYDTLPSLVIFLWHDYPDRRWCFWSPHAPPSPLCMSFYLYFQADEFEQCFKWGKSNKKYFVAVFLRFQSFWCIKNYFPQLSEHFLGSQKISTLSFAQNNVAVFISFYEWTITDSDVFTLFSEINWILFQISLIPIYLAYRYLGALYQKNKM